MNGNAQRIVATAILAMLAWLVADQRGLRGEVRQIHSDIADLRERMARLEGRVDTLVEIFTEREAER